MSYQQGYPGQGGYPVPVAGGPNPATAIVAGILGLLVAAAMVVVDIALLDELDGLPLSALPGEFTALVVIRFAAAALALVGAVVVFVRQVAGAVILALGLLGAIAAVLLVPVLLRAGMPPDTTFGGYLRVLFGFGDASATFSAIALCVAPLALILTLIPPTLRYLRGRPATDPGYQWQQPNHPGGW